jgi:hypothetical protein
MIGLLLKIFMMKFKKLENDNYEIGIHIADVSYYVKSLNLFLFKVSLLQVIDILYL